MNERLQKLIAQAGLCSRREAEDLIRESRVRVNGKVAQIGDKADALTDAIKVDNRLLFKLKENKSPTSFLFFKPKGVLSDFSETSKEAHVRRPTVSDFTRNIKRRLTPVGKMPFGAEGLMLLTDDGKLANTLARSKSVTRTFEVKIKGLHSEEKLKKLLKPQRIEGRTINPQELSARRLEAKTKVKITFQGMGSFDVHAFFQRSGFLSDSIRCVQIGNLKLAGLKAGEYRATNVHFSGDKLVGA